MKKSIAIIGGRGYVGEVLLQLIQGHPNLELAWISSRSLAGRTVQSVYEDIPLTQSFLCVDPENVAEKPADVLVLALPNDIARSYTAHTPSSQKIVDLSADYRFDDNWTYGLPERNREQIRGATHVSNPGCYATAIQLALAPLLGKVEEAPSAFGVSGYSGAGRTPSARNNPDRLKDNIQPYKLSGHVHENEVSRQLNLPVRFFPHVAEFFRGISVTISATLDDEVEASELRELFENFYAEEALVDISADIPEVNQIAETPRIAIGGFTVDQRDPRRVSLVSCIDNLLKGAASQALQNINLMLDIDETVGIEA